MASASISLPSASVLPISTVFPLKLLTISPGRVASPDGMFSTTGRTPITRIFGLSPAVAISAAATVAAPAISIFMVSRDPVGLRFIPPESKVTPLPTRTTVVLKFFGLYSRQTMHGLLRLPCATASIAPNFFCFKSFSVNISTLRFAFLACVAIDLANCSGLLSLEGVFTHSRAKMVPVQTALTIEGSFLKALAVSGSTRKLMAFSAFCFFSFLYLS